ncbi:MAG TPA: hypothetical protein VK002_07455 [Rubricoccaceae bacterium]|nr:hypothetical protein [Rubricoccaceae bacterium]
MPPRVPSGPPLSSRAVLLVGALALVCLALFAALLFEAAEPGQPALALDGPAPATAAGGGVARPATDRPAASAAPDVVFADDPEPIPSGVLTALEQAAEEPLEVELARLLDALQHGFGERSVQVEPTLRPYAFRLAGRLNVRSVSFLVRVSAPDPALAEARAATLRNLFEAAGVAPGRLTIVPRRGAPVLLAEPA